MCAARPNPQRLGRYEILESLAQGRMGMVYKGFDRDSGRTAALKTIPKERLEQYGSAVMLRFQNEARAATNLHHPGIAEVYEYGEDAGLAFIAMEYLDSCGIKPRTGVPIEDAASLMVQLLDALDYAHDQGVVHREIKPSNLLLTPDGKLRVTGFGVARLELGTPNYVSPEQFMGAPVDRRSDIFSSGVVFYELLTGVAPFGGSKRSLIDSICAERERVPSEVNPNLPGGFDLVIARALAKASYERYPTARAFADGITGAFSASFSRQVNPFLSSKAVAVLACDPKNPEKESTSALSSLKPRVPGNGVGFTWDEDVLKTVEKDLAVFVGPLARLIVKEAASKTTDLERLRTLVAESLAKDQDRKAFLARGGDVGTPPRSAPAEPSKSAAGPSGSRIPVAPKPSVRPETPPVARVATPPDPKITPRPGPAPGASVAPPKSKSDAKLAPAKASPAKAVPVQASPRVPASFLPDHPRDLAAYLRDNPAQVEEVIHPFVATMDAVGALHSTDSKNVALTPQNICFTPNGSASIRESLTSSTQSSGVMVGNPRYTAPEMFAEKAAADDPAIPGAHAYALGFMFYEIVLGRKLFEKTFATLRTDLDWLSWQADLEKKAPSIKSMLPDCPVALSDLLETMMEKRVEKRTVDLQIIRAGLVKVAQRANRTMVVQRPAAMKVESAASPAAKKKGGTKFLVFMLLLLVLAAGAGLLYWQDPDIYQQAAALFHRLLQ